MFMNRADRDAAGAWEIDDTERTAGIGIIQPRMAEQGANRRQADGFRHIGHVKLNAPPTSRSPPSIPSRTFSERRSGTTVSAARPTAARRFAPCWVVSFVFCPWGRWRTGHSARPRADPVAMDRIVCPLRHGFGRDQDRSGRPNGPPGTIHAPKAQAQRIEGSGFRDQTVQFQVDPHLQALGVRSR